MEGSRRVGRASIRIALVVIALLLVGVSLQTSDAGASTAEAEPPEPVGEVLPSNHTDPAVGWAWGSLYLFGGEIDGEATSGIWGYTPGSPASVELPASLPSARTGVAAASFSGHTFLFGGEGAEGYTDEILRFDGRDRDLTALASTLPTPRRDVGVSSMGSLAVLIGGYNGSWSHETYWSNGNVKERWGAEGLDSVLTFDPIGEEIHTVDLSLPLRSYNLSVASHGDRLVAVGGECGSRHEVRFDEEGDPIEHSDSTCDLSGPDDLVSIRAQPPRAWGIEERMRRAEPPILDGEVGVAGAESGVYVFTSEGIHEYVPANGSLTGVVDEVPWGPGGVSAVEGQEAVFIQVDGDPTLYRWTPPPPTTGDEVARRMAENASQTAQDAEEVATRAREDAAQALADVGELERRLDNGSGPSEGDAAGTNPASLSVPVLLGVGMAALLRRRGRDG